MNVLINGKKPNLEDRDVFLADVLVDPTEFTNLAGEGKYAEVVRELSGQLDKHTENSVEVEAECLQR